MWNLIAGNCIFGLYMGALIVDSPEQTEEASLNRRFHDTVRSTENEYTYIYLYWVRVMSHSLGCELETPDGQNGSPYIG